MYFSLCSPLRALKSGHLAHQALRVALLTTLSMLVATVLLDPGDGVVHLKVPLLLLTLGLWAVRVIFGMSEPGGLQLWAFVSLFASIVPGAATLVGLLGSSLAPGELHFQMIKEFSVLLLIPVLLSERIDLTQHIIRWSLAIAIFTLILVVLSFVAPLSFSVIRDYAVAQNDAFISSRSLLGLGIGSFYYKTVGVLVFPIAYYFQILLYRPRALTTFVLLITFIAAVLASDSRAATLAVLFIIAVLLFLKLKAKRGLPIAIATVFLVAALPAGYVISFFRPSESSNSVKLGHIRSYISEFDAHPEYLLWGQGADTQFYSEGFEAKTTLTELTYFDMIRWLGIPSATFCLIFALYPAFRLKSHDRSNSHIVTGYVAYLFEAATDPLLICSTGLMIVGAVWAITLMSSAKKTNALRAEVQA